MNHNLLEVTGVSKSYPGVRALSDVDLVVAGGEIHGVVGENGAGKSTLMNVIAGSLVPDSGKVRIAGSYLEPISPERSRDLGVAIVRQEPALLPDLSVAENLFLKVPPRLRPAAGGLKRWAEEAVRRWNPDLSLSVDLRVEQLTAEERFIVEIVAAIASDPKVLLLDEPTEHLTKEEVKHLFEVVRGIAAQGCAVVYISHRIYEVQEISETLTVLRDGEGRGRFETGSLSENEIITLIVGRNLDSTFPPKRLPEAGAAAPRLSVKNLLSPGFNKLSFDIQPGEIVGLAGIEGNGQREVLRALAGLRPSSGEVLIDGRSVSYRSRKAGIQSGVGFLPGDRHREGMLAELSVADNIELRNLTAISAGGVLMPSRAEKLVSDSIKEFNIKTPRGDTTIGLLSGGNQQKAIISSVISGFPRVLLIDEPTQGVDVGAKSEIYEQLRKKASEGGLAIVVVSSDAFELAGLCDRVMVFSRGTVVNMLEGEQLTEANITGSALTTTTIRIGDDAPQKKKSKNHFLSGDMAPVAIVAGVIALIAIVASILNPFYASAFNISALLTLIVPLAAVALGQATVMMTGGIDLSVGPLMGLLVVFASFHLTAEAGFGQQVFGWVVMLVIAVLVGMVNWALIDLLGLPALVATLATYFAIQALSLLLRPAPGGSISPGIVSTFSYKIGAVVPVTLVAVVVVAVLLHVLLRRAKVGMELRSVGSSSTVSLQLGIRPKLIRFGAYVVCSLLACLGAIALMAQVGTGDPALGANYTLISISAAVIGGVSLFGGRGSYIGALLGAVLVQQVIGAIPFLKLAPEWQYYIVGALTLVAVAVFSKARQRSTVE